MCRQIRKKGYRKPTIQKKSYTNYNRMDGEYPGHKVQVDIKYVPNECIRFPCYGQQYYQITAIDEYSRRRVLKIVKEKSTYETGKFLISLEDRMGFPIEIIQVDNGAEFVNDEEKTEKKETKEKDKESKKNNKRKNKKSSAPKKAPETAEIEPAAAEAPAQEKAAPAPKKKAAVPQLTDVKIAEIKKAAHDFLEGVFKTMEMDVEISEDYQKDTGILTVNMEGEDMGVLIGKRGQTLDSLQYLVSLVVNKDIDGYIHVKADTENYRERRKKTLENLAKNIAFKVKRTRQPVALEPMNPYERRIIHSALQNEKFITTYSEGEEPYRKVIVALKKDENGDVLLQEERFEKGGRGRNGRGRNGRGGRKGRDYKGSRDNRRKSDQPEEGGQAADAAENTEE